MVENGVVNLFKGKVQLILFHKKHYWNNKNFSLRISGASFVPKSKNPEARQSADTVLIILKNGRAIRKVR